MTGSASAGNPLLSLDAVFGLKAPAGATPTCKLRLTPLSKKACLIHGIDPSVLREREYASFHENGQDPEIQTMKYECYSRTRQKLMDVASEERAKLAAKASRHDDSFSTTDSVSLVSRATSMVAPFDDKEQEISTLIENEKRRLEKVARRQQKELMRMLAFESKSKEIMQRMQAKTDEQARKEAQRKKEKRRRDLQDQEEARIRELRRKAKEEAEASLSRVKVQEQFERERKIRQRRLREEKEAKLRARVEEEERIKKREAHRLQTKKIYDQQRKETERKLRERERKEKERDAKLELKRLVDAQAAEAKRKEAAERIESNLKAARQHQEEKRNQLLQKQVRQEEFMEGIVREKQHNLVERKKRTQAIESKRQHQLKKTRQDEELHKRGVLSKIEQDELHLKDLTEERRREQLIVKAERDLNLQMKRENLERIARAREYQMQETRRKAEASNRRCEDMKRNKDDLLRLRRKNAHEAKVRKDKLMETLERSKGGGASQIKKLLKSAGVGDEPESADPKPEPEVPGTDVPLFEDERPPPVAPYKSSYITEDFLDAPSFEDEHPPPPVEPHKSPYITDDFLGIGDISLNDR